MPKVRQGVSHVQVDTSPMDQLRLARLARELRLMNQILAIDVDTLTIHPNGPAPAWTTLTGDHINFAYDRMPKLKGRYELAIWLGTNAHELGHGLFSPREHSLLMRRIKDAETVLYPRMGRLHNIVEDQREERLLIGRFSSWEAYLTACLGYHLKADKDTAWLLMAGRTWLPDKTRQLARERFVARHGDDMADKVVELIGAYQKLLDPGEYEADEAWAILLKLYDLFEDIIPEGGGCTVIRGGEPDTDEPDSDDLPPTADEYGDPCSDGDPASDPGDGKTGDKPTNEDPTGKPTAGNAPGDRTKPIKDELQKQIQKALADAVKDLIFDDPKVSEDLENVLDALDHGRESHEAEGAIPDGKVITASDAARALHRELSDALLDLKDASEPGWVRRTDSGRLNVRRMLFDPSADIDTLFDRYDPGQMDAADFEVCLLVDISGSMSPYVRKLGEAIWAMRQAVYDLDGRITVMAYESGPHQVLAVPGDTPDDRMLIPRATGGTQPLSAIKESWKVLGEAQAKNVMLVILTDGSWYTHEGDRIIEAMKSVGIITVFAQLGSYYVGTHGCEYGGSVDDPIALARMFRRIAAERIESWL